MRPNRNKQQKKKTRQDKARPKITPGYISLNYALCGYTLTAIKALKHTTGQHHKTRTKLYEVRPNFSYYIT